jgi:ubiquinone/menaquinone biosynthesis C-methylase UbiE
MYNRTADNSIYLNENRYKEPKELFKQAAQLLNFTTTSPESCAMLDIGGATGEFLYYIRSIQPHIKLHCVEYSPAMVELSKNVLRQYHISIEEGDANDLKTIADSSYDYVTTLGVTSIFDDFRPSFKEMIRVAKPGGRCMNAMLVNEDDVDVLIKYLNNGYAESGWNKFSLKSIRHYLESRKDVTEIQFIKHVMPFDIEKRYDPMRSYTKISEKGERILWNGLNMEISIYFILFTKTS